MASRDAGRGRKPTSVEKPQVPLDVSTEATIIANKWRCNELLRLLQQLKNLHPEAMEKLVSRSFWLLKV